LVVDLGYEAGREAAERIARKQEQIATERRSAEEELRAQEARQAEARASIARIEVEQRAADNLLNSAQRRLFEAREAMQAQASRTAEAKASHAALVERATGLAVEVQRLEEVSQELDARARIRQEDLTRTQVRRAQLQSGIVSSEATLDEGLREFDHLRDKAFNISAKLVYRSWEAILTEIKKCEVVCANCHRRRTGRRLGSHRVLALEGRQE